ncbi:MAG TPA: helix-turn-helix transcriptional regulator [Arachidicoccus sp.]
MARRLLISSLINTLLIILWAYAALSKLSEYCVFTDQLKRQPLPLWSTGILSWALPLVEFATSVLIYCQRTRMTALIISSLLMTAFTLYVLFALSGAFGDIPCSCALLVSSLRWQGHLVFNIFFSVLCFAGVYLEKLLTDYLNSNDLISKGLPTVQYVAETLNVSPGYLSSLLRVLTRQNTQQHIHDKLIEKVKEKLSATNLSVSEIAYELGFEHLRSFSKLFKKKTEMSPLEFRVLFN